VNITEDDLETIFTEFGELDKVTLARDESGVSKGYAYVKYVLFEVFVARSNFLDIRTETLPSGR
jgi:hypothetical protein